MAVEKYVYESITIKKDDSLILSDKAGIFVTLNYVTYDGAEELRGCIGLPFPEKELNQSVIEAAIAAATEDPRFPPLSKQELQDIIFEVSVLTIPEEIKARNEEDFESEITIGRDGLILRWKYGSGLLLPQVAVEFEWNVKDYLAHICYKAGAPSQAWLLPESKLYKFQATIFKELEPGGNVVRTNVD